MQDRILLKKEMKRKGTYLNSVMNIIFKSIFIEEKRYLINVLTNEFFHVYVKGAEERVSKGKNKGKEVWNYFIRVNSNLIFIKYNKGNEYA